MGDFVRSKGYLDAKFTLHFMSRKTVIYILEAIIMETLYKYWLKFLGYMQRTWLAKIIVVAIILLGLLYTAISHEEDVTFVVFTLMFGVPAFIMDWKDEDYTKYDIYDIEEEETC